MEDAAAPDPVSHASTRRGLVRDAAWLAWERVASCGPGPSELFAPLGELLLWIDAERDVVVALESASHGPDLPMVRDTYLLDALAFARNLMVHEYRVYEHRFEDVLIDTCTDFYGAWIWSPVDGPATLRDSDPWSLLRAGRTAQSRHAAYMARLGSSGESIVDSTRCALAALGFGDAAPWHKPALEPN